MTASAVDRNQQDSLRAGTWTLLGRLLVAPPDAELLEQLRRIEQPAAADAMARAWAGLGETARRSEPERIAYEYQEVFIGVGGGEIIPYASYYLSGALMERPLVELRQDLQLLGVERRDGVSEPEDHAGLVCEVMALIIDDAELAPNWQQTFFQRHVERWMGRFFKELQQVPSADFYRALGGVGEEFVGLERSYFSMPA